MPLKTTAAVRQWCQLKWDELHLPPHWQLNPLQRIPRCLQQPPQWTSQQPPLIPLSAYTGQHDRVK